jgi:hypothetical protein
MSADVAERVRAHLASDFVRDFARFGNAVGMGFWSSTGREIPIVVEPVARDGWVRLSDAGEAWFEMVSEGLFNPAPTQTERRRLVALCRSFGVEWDVKRCAVTATCAIEDASKVARRVLSASITMEGWRLFAPEAPEVAARRSTIIDSVRSLATEAKLIVDAGGVLRGKSGHDWPVDTILRTERNAVGVEMLTDTLPVFAGRAIGWSYDTRAPLIVLASARRAEKIEGMALGPVGPVRAVAHDDPRAAARVVELAESFASPAA